MHDEIRQFVIDTISDICSIPADTIGPSAHLLDELGVDSVDMLDVVHEIDRKFSISLPLEEWAAAVSRGEASANYFMLDKLVDNIASVRSSAAAE
jgi:acyl carrier protein